MSDDQIIEAMERAGYSDEEIADEIAKHHHKTMLLCKHCGIEYQQINIDTLYLCPKCFQDLY